jgi:hypothetical protein
MTSQPRLLSFTKHLNLRESLLKRGALRSATQGYLKLHRFTHALM